MADRPDPDPLSAAELDEMTPDERATAFQERIVTNEESIPADFWQRIQDRARSLGLPTVDKTG